MRRRNKGNINITAILITLFIVVAVIAVFRKRDNEILINKLEKENYCYQVLYNEDIIGNGCDKYFENDSWYQEYKEDLNK